MLLLSPATSVAVSVFLLASSATALADSDRCAIRVGQERPQGCTPYKARSVKPRARAKPVRAPRPGQPDSSLGEPLRVPNKENLEERSRILLTHELVRLESLLRHTAVDSPDRAGIVRRLADGYAELEALAWLEHQRAARRAQRAARVKRSAASRAGRTSGHR